MAVTSKNLHSVQQAHRHGSALPRRLYTAAYGVTLLLFVLAAYTLVSLLLGKLTIFLDDVRYGRPRISHVDAFVGHDEASGQPTHLMAINLNRQVFVIELPGGNPANTRTLAGPYLIGAQEDLTPVQLFVHDMDGDGQNDLLLDVRREQIVYLNRDGSFRLPTAEEEAQLKQGNHP
jgi:hypothetical protein